MRTTWRAGVSLGRTDLVGAAALADPVVERSV
jgi:hypothetical protein